MSTSAHLAKRCPPTVDDIDTVGIINAVFIGGYTDNIPYSALEILDGNRDSSGGIWYTIALMKLN